MAASKDLPGGQLGGALDEIGQNRKSANTKKLYIFGYNISHSLSPTIHNAGFKYTGFDGHYTIYETPEVDGSIAALLADPDFAGASVTFPHKLQVAGLLDSVSEAAKKIGAINTISKKDGKLWGDNTDWSGVKACIDSAEISGLTDAPAIVLGAGGAARAACYALVEMGFPKILVVNRTRANAEAMISRFPEASFNIFGKLEEAVEACKTTPARVVVGCIPADDLTEDKIPVKLFGGAAESGVLVEMAYRPPVTGMEKAAAKSSGWRIFKGIDVLREQGYAQFSIWTGKEAPKEAMSKAMDDELKRRAAEQRK